MVAFETMQLIVASQSPRRQELLRNAGFAFEVVPSGIEEVSIVRPATEPDSPIGGETANTMLVGAVLGLASTAWLRVLPESRRLAAGKR